MREYFCAGQLSAANSECCSVALDGSRLGEPAKEHVMFHMQLPDKSVGMWLPPQATSVGHHSSPKCFERRLFG